MQCHREAALAWNGTLSADQRGLPALPSTPLHLQPCLVFTALAFSLEEACLRRSSDEPCASAVRSVSPARFLPSSSPLSPGPLTFSPGSFPAADSTCRAAPALWKPCLEPASSSGYSHPSPSPLCLQEVVSPPRRSLAPELAVTLLLPARGWKRSHWSSQWPPRDRFAVISSPTFLKGRSLRLSPPPTRSVLGSMLNSLLRPLPSHIHTKAPVGSLFLGQGCPKSTPIYLTTGQLQTDPHLEILWAAPIYCALTMFPLLLPTSSHPLFIS